jgi:hypothetical protein
VRRLRRRFRRNSATLAQRRSRSVRLCDKNRPFVTSGPAAEVCRSFNKGVTLGALGRSEDEIAVYNDLLSKFASATELPLREQVAKAFVNKAIRLGALGRSEDEIAVYDDLLARFGMATESPLREIGRQGQVC